MHRGAPLRAAGFGDARRELLAGDTATLTAAELRRLRAMLAAFDTFLAGGKLGKWFLGAIILLASGIAAWTR